MPLNTPPRAVAVPRTLALGLLLGACAGAAWSAETPEQGLRRCRGVADAAARLACYDALAPAGSSPSTLAPAAAVAAAPSPAAAAVPVPPVLPPAPRTAGVPTLTPPAAAPAPAAVDQARFGLENPAEAAPALTSRIAGTFEGWDPGTRIRLVNGQVWRVVDGSSVSVFLKDPAVRIERTAFGSYRLEVQGVKTSPRVQRVE